MLIESPLAANQGFGIQLDLDVEGAVSAHWNPGRTEQVVRHLLSRELPLGEYAMALHLVDDPFIQELNRRHRELDRATDVLSFPLHDPHGMRFVLPPGQPVNLGDVVISYPRVVAQAEEFGHSIERELMYLTAHGVLHLLGFDHERPDEQAEMRRREEEALEDVGLSR